MINNMDIVIIYKLFEVELKSIILMEDNINYKKELMYYFTRIFIKIC